MSSQEQLNSLIQTKLADIVNQEVHVPETLITILRVSSDDKVSQAHVSISVLPNNFSGSALKALRQHNKVIAEKLHKQAKLRRVPKLFWVLDSGAKTTDGLEEIFQQIAEESYDSE